VEIIGMTGSLPSHAFVGSSAFTRYRVVLHEWLDDEAGDERDLYEAGALVCASARAHGVSPELLLFELHAVGVRARDALNTGVVASCDERYIVAVHVLMQQCFRDSSPPRVVRDVDGRDWSVMAVREGQRWDPEIEMRRRDWLCCVTRGDRRYISPVPPEWEQWSPIELAAAIRKARPDLRGPR
jgi:hypothetical protein